MENFSIEIHQVINSERIVELQSHHFSTNKEWVAPATVTDGCYTCSQRWTGAVRREDRADCTWPTHSLDRRKCRYPHKPKSNWGSGSTLYRKFKNPKNIHPKKKDWYAELKYSSGQKAWCFHTKFWHPQLPPTPKRGKELRETKWDPRDITEYRPRPIWTRAKHT